MKETDFSRDILPLKNKLFRVALGITLDRTESEDIVQETLLRVWSKRGEWQNMESVEAYSLTVARNLAIDSVRRSEAQNVSLTDEVVETAGASDSSNPFDRLAGRERLRIVSRLIEALPEKQKNVLRLRDIEEMSYQEIASKLGITEEQVKVNLFRARQKIRQGLTNIENYGL